MSQTTIAQFLKSLDIFADFEDEDLLDLASLVDQFDFDEESIIAYQRDVADKLYIVRSGRLFAFEMDSQGVVRDSRSYFPGSYFEDTWLFATQAHEYTVRGAEKGRLYIIEQDKFLRFLNDYPDLLDLLHLSEEAQSYAETATLSQPKGKRSELNLLPDEHVLFLERRTVWLLVLELIGPLLLFLIWTGIVLYFFSLSTTLTALIIGLPGLFALLLSIWRTMDWANDYFVITDKHLIHHEYSLRGFQVRINKIPVDQIQSVETERPTLLANLLNTGSARITTSAQASAIRFDYIDNPNRVVAILDDLKDQAKAVNAGQTQMDMRAALEDHFDSGPSYQPVEQESGADEDEEEWEYAPQGPVDYLFDGLYSINRIIGRIFSTRTVQGNVITYHKHPVTLLRKTWWVLLLNTLILLVAYWVHSNTFRLILAVFWLITLFIFIWFFLNWRNDLYQLTDRYVFDIDRLPFGFGESKKQAELSNIQNVNAEKPGLMATLFNYGYVTVETAGASPNIVFEKISNPGQAQNDIFQRRDELKQNQEDNRRYGRRREFAVMLDVYHQAQQAGRIPDRVIDEEAFDEPEDQPESDYQP